MNEKYIDCYSNFARIYGGGGIAAEPTKGRGKVYKTAQHQIKAAKTKSKVGRKRK